MAGSRGRLEEAAVVDESPANLAKSFVDFLKQHRPIFHELKEMFERFMDMESNETTATQTSDLSREEKEKRKKADLHYKKKLAEKDRRIMQLESELKEKTLENENRLSRENEESIACWREKYCKLQEQFKNRTDAYFKEIDAINGEKTELTERIDAYLKEIDAINGEKTELIERISSLQNEVTSKDLEMVLITSNKEEHIQEYKNRFNQLKEQYEKATSRNDQELKDLNFRNEDLKQQIRTQEDQVKEYEAKYNRLTEYYKSFLATKDEELKGIKTRNEDLTKQIRNKEHQVKEYEAKYNKLTEDPKGLLANKDEELKGIKTRFSDFKERCRVFVEEKDEELKKMKTRLAHLSEKQVLRDQRKIEDTTSSNRPSEVEQDFTAFFDDERMDACEKMQEVYGSEEESEVCISYPRLACMIFETAYEAMNETKEALLTLFKVISKRMIDLAPTMGAEYASRAKERRLPYNIPFNIIAYGPELEFPIDVFDALVLSLKETAHKCDLESLERGVKGKIRQKWLQWLIKEKSCRFSFSEHLLTQLSDYINACIRLTWRMVTQVPPMQLEYQSPTLKDIHKNLGYHSSPEMCSRRTTTEGQASDEELEIACYLWPALLDGGGKLIRAGEVVCKVKEEITDRD